MKWMLRFVIWSLVVCSSAFPVARAEPASEPGVLFPVRTIKIEGSPHDLAFDRGTLYVSCFHGANLTVVDTRSRSVAKQVHLDAYESVTDGMETPKKRDVQLCPPGDLVAANGKLFVGQLFSDFLVVFDIATLWVVKRIPIEGEGFFAAAADGKTVYFASNRKNEFSIIDTETYRFKTIAYPTGGRGIGSIALSPDGKRLYLGIQRGGKAPDGKEHGGGNSFLAVYDLTKEAYTRSLYLAQILPSGDSDDSIPRKLLFSRDGRRLYAGMSQSLAGIQVIDPDKLKIERQIAFAPTTRNKFFDWVDPIGLATYRTWLIAANRNNREVVILDGSSYQTLARLTFADEKRGVANVLVDGDRIYLGDEDSHAVYELNGRNLARVLRSAAPNGKDKKLLEITLQN